jgi:hypothetical protein
VWEIGNDVVAANASNRARVQRDDRGEPIVRQPPAGYVGLHRLIPDDDNPIMPLDSSSTQDNLRDAATAYLPRVGQLDHEPSTQATDDLADERAAATRAIHQGTRPDLVLLQQVLDGLRRL